MQVMKRNVDLQGEILQSSTILLIVLPFVSRDLVCFYFSPLAGYIISSCYSSKKFFQYTLWSSHSDLPSGNVLRGQFSQADVFRELQTIFIWKFFLFAELDCEELEWGNEVHLQHIKDSYPDGFDLILGADIYILFVQILQLHQYSRISTVRFSFC